MNKVLISPTKSEPINKSKPTLSCDVRLFSLGVRFGNINIFMDVPKDVGFKI